MFGKYITGESPAFDISAASCWQFAYLIELNTAQNKKKGKDRKKNLNGKQKLFSTIFSTIFFFRRFFFLIKTSKITKLDEMRNRSNLWGKWGRVQDGRCPAAKGVPGVKCKWAEEKMRCQGIIFRGKTSIWLDDVVVVVVVCPGWSNPFCQTILIDLHLSRFWNRVPPWLRLATGPTRQGRAAM